MEFGVFIPVANVRLDRVRDLSEVGADVRAP